MVDCWVIIIDIVCYVLHFLPIILLVLPVQAWAYVELRNEQQWRKVMIGVVAVAALATSSLWLARVPVAVWHDWTPIRLVPAFAWRNGYQLYYPADQGPVFVQIY